MASMIISSMAMMGAFLLVLLFGGLIVVVLFQSIEDNRPDIAIALLAVALLAYYVGYRVGGL